MAKGSQRSRTMHKAAKRQAARVYDKCGGVCYWCGETLVRRQELPSDRILSKSGSMTMWFRDYDGNVVKLLPMTIDHIIPLEEGGTSAFDNLVASCGLCNNRRSQKRRKPRLVCKKCGADKPDSHDDMCQKCRGFYLEKYASIMGDKQRRRFGISIDIPNGGIQNT